MIKSGIKGVGLIEIIIVSAVLAFVISALMFAASNYIKFSHRNTANIKAGYLLEEGVEAVKIMRDTSWSSQIASIPINSVRYLSFSANTWQATSTNNFVDGVYDRTVNFDTAYRDSESDFALSGTSDPDARKVTVTVSWFDNFSNSTTTKSLSTYIVDLFDN